MEQKTLVEKLGMYTRPESYDYGIMKVVFKNGDKDAHTVECNYTPEEIKTAMLNGEMIDAVYVDGTVLKTQLEFTGYAGAADTITFVSQGDPANYIKIVAMSIGSTSKYTYSKVTVSPNTVVIIDESTMKSTNTGEVITNAYTSQTIPYGANIIIKIQSTSGARTGIVTKAVTGQPVEISAFSHSDTALSIDKYTIPAKSTTVTKTTKTINYN